MANRERQNIKFDTLVGPGENPEGFTSQTANGTGKAGNNRSGWNRQYNPPTSPEVEATGPWGNGNRSSE